MRPRGKLSQSRLERLFHKCTFWLEQFVTVELLFGIIMFMIAVIYFVR